MVILVEPKNDGNIGAVCRAMKNFGFSELYIVNHPKLSDDAHKRAMHAGDVLRSARHFKSLDAALRKVDIAAGTSGKIGFSRKNFLRQSLTPEQFAQNVAETDATVGILFGREDFGLLNNELEKCDLVIQIPASPQYPSMNLSHAAAVVLYEMFLGAYSAGAGRKLTRVEKERLFSFFDTLVDSVHLTDDQREKSKIMFKRLVSRAAPSEHEFSLLMGVLNRTLRRIQGVRSAPKIPGRTNAKPPRNQIQIPSPSKAGAKPRRRKI